MTWAELFHRLVRLHIGTLEALMLEFEYQNRIDIPQYHAEAVTAFMDWCLVQGQTEHLMFRVLELFREILWLPI